MDAAGAGRLRLADGLVEGGAGRDRPLERLASLVDWTGSSGCSARSMRRRSGGRHSGRWCCCAACSCSSGPGCGPRLEEALSDRLSFRRFVGLALADPVPDRSTLSRFRSEFVRRGLSGPLLAELDRQLDAKGLMVEAGR